MPTAVGAEAAAALPRVAALVVADAALAFDRGVVAAVLAEQVRGAGRSAVLLERPAPVGGVGETGSPEEPPAQPVVLGPLDAGPVAASLPGLAEALSAAQAHPVFVVWL